MNVLMVDDHVMFLQGMKNLLSVLVPNLRVGREKARLDVLLGEPGPGTTFKPRIEGAKAPERERPLAAARSFDGTRLAVLLVDDEVEVLAALSPYLHQLGWSVEGVASGDAAEQALRQGFEADVMVVDFRLKGETGVEVIERLRRLQPALRDGQAPAHTLRNAVLELDAQAERALA